MNTENDAMGHVLVDIVTDRIDATNLMNVEGYGTPHLAQHDEATLPSNGVKGMFGVFCLFLPYLICSIIIIDHKFSICVVGRRKNVG
jgi:hypothetical protein